MTDNYATPLLCRLGLHDWNRPRHGIDVFQAWWRVVRSCRRGCGARKVEHDNYDQHVEGRHEKWTDEH